MNEPTRRAWSRPELIVIVRGGPEEAVLVACKTGTYVAGGGYLDDYYGCVASDGGCRTCFTFTGS